VTCASSLDQLANDLLERLPLAWLLANVRALPTFRRRDLDVTVELLSVCRGTLHISGELASLKLVPQVGQPVILKTGTPLSRLQLSGCKLSRFMFGLLCMSENGFSGDVMGFLVLLTYSFPPQMRVVGIQAHHGGFSHYENPISQFIRRDCAFWVDLVDTRAKPLSRNYVSEDEAWDTESSREPTSSHSFLLLIVSDRAMILQGYYGHYSYGQWRDFSVPLERGVERAPKNPAWLRNIVPAPRFRGLLSWQQTTELALGIDSLSEEGNHIATFANITGISHDEASIAPFYLVRFCRLDLALLWQLRKGQS